MKEGKVRQLAAVMFTDIVGYTALMQGDERIAIRSRTRHQSVLEKQHQLHQGKIVQYYGDGALSVFKSAVEAVNCAIAIQRLLQEGEPVPVRIGLHMGDIVYSEIEVYGDAVNLASRIESLAVAGAILVSGKLNDELKNHNAISTSSLGHFELKNIATAVEVYAVTNQGITVPHVDELKKKQRMNSRTIAVLPFVNMSTSQENEYFSDGITEEIINALAKVKSLKVTSRTSSFFFKNKNIPIRKIAKELKVSAILEGSVRLSGDTLRITAQLIQAEEDFHFWSDTWDRKLENVFEIQDEISLMIADKLREQFGHFEIQEHLVNKQTDNIDAYSYSLKAKFHANKWNPEDMRSAISIYEQALKLDPKHCESLLGLADCYSFMAMTAFMSFEEAWGKAKQLIDQALLLDDNLAGAYYQLANSAFFTECDFRRSLELASKAVRINPNHIESQRFLSFLYILSGAKERSRQHLNAALAIDPLSQETRFFSAYLDYMLEDYSSCLEQLNTCLDENPKNIPALSVKSTCLLLLGRYDEVIHFFDAMPPEIVITGEKTGAIALAYAMKKDGANTASDLKQLQKQAEGDSGFTASSYLFMLYAVMGDLDKAFQWIEEAITERSSLLLLRFADPLVNGLKSDPRYDHFQRILFSEDLTVKSSKKKKELLDADSVLSYSSKLLEHLRTKEPYLDQNLTLRSLADQIDIHPNQLSWLLNTSLGRNFNEFINHHRVSAFKRRARDPKNSHLTLIALAYDSGFNSKTAFNTYFKKETGLTPKQFMQEHKQ